MIHFEATAALRNPVRPDQVANNVPVVAEFIDYIRWLADQNTGRTVTIGQLWELYHESVVECRYWSEVCEELELPVRDSWLG